MPTSFEPNAALCACLATRRAARAVTQLFDVVLAPTGLKATQYLLLQTIAEQGEIAQCDLAREYVASTETLSRRLASMRRAGWIRLQVSGKRREHVYAITNEGSRVLAEAAPFWARAQSRLAQAHELSGGGDLNSAVRAMNQLTQAARESLSLRTTNGVESASAKAAHA